MNGRSFSSWSKMLGGRVSSRTCRRAAFSADIRGGCGSCWEERLIRHINTTQSRGPTAAAGPEGPTFRSWQGVWPKLLMMPSRAFRSVSSAMASRSTAPAEQRERQQEDEQEELGCTHLTLIGAVVEDVESFDGLLATLLVAKDQVDPLVQVTGHVFALLPRNKRAAVSVHLQTDEAS